MHCANSCHPGDVRGKSGSAPGCKTSLRRGPPRPSAAPRKSIEITRPLFSAGPPHRWFWLGIRCEIFPRPKQWIRCPHRREGVSVRENVKIHGGKRWPRVPYSCAQIQCFQPKLFCLFSPNPATEPSPELPETPRHSRVTPGPPGCSAPAPKTDNFKRILITKQQFSPPGRSWPLAERPQRSKSMLWKRISMNKQ